MAEFPESELLEQQRYDLNVSTVDVGQRLDQFLGHFGAALSEPLSRSLCTNLIKRGNVRVNSKVVKASYRLRHGDSVIFLVPPPEPMALVPEKVDFQVVFEDSDILVICKPPDLVVHPACGHQSGTLVHGLLYHCKDLNGINGTVRPGIVHRLDKDTSGLLVVAKNDLAQQGLVAQFKEKSVGKKYLAIVTGAPDQSSGTITGNIGRHPVNRKKMAMLQSGGRHSVTHWKLLERFRDHSLIELQLETGRTHQIRVHLASIGLPIAGDKVYGRKRQEAEPLKITRQCLHAARLTFMHPRTGESLQFQAPLWLDISYTLSVLQSQVGEG